MRTARFEARERQALAESEARKRIEVRVELKPGVMDAEAESVEKSLGLLGLHQVTRVHTAHLYTLDFEGVDEAEAQHLAHQAVDRLLANPVIHRVSLRSVVE